MDFLTFLWLLSFTTFSLCTYVNITIDDSLGDESNGNMITYSNGWNVGQACVGCTAKPDASQAFEHTWHDGTYLPVSLGGDGELVTASVSFIGASYVRRNFPMLTMCC